MKRFTTCLCYVAFHNLICFSLSLSLARFSLLFAKFLVAKLEQQQQKRFISNAPPFISENLIHEFFSFFLSLSLRNILHRALFVSVGKKFQGKFEWKRVKTKIIMFAIEENVLNQLNCICVSNAYESHG